MHGGHIRGMMADHQEGPAGPDRRGEAAVHSLPVIPGRVQELHGDQVEAALWGLPAEHVSLLPGDARRDFVARPLR